MTIPTGVDDSAPVIAHQEIEIEAQLSTVWKRDGVRRGSVLVFGARLDHH
jgi:hypothetical protein